MNQSRPRISVVVPAYNEEDYIGPTLDSLGRAADFFRRTTGREIEIVVVDNASADRTAAIAAQKGARVVTETVRQIARVRNRGAEESAGELIVTCDADNQVPENIFVRIDQVMSTGKYIGGGVRILPDKQHWGITLMVNGFNIIGDLVGVSFGVMYTDRGTFFSVGGFPTSVYVGEDALFGWALKKEGRRRGLRYATLKDVAVVTSMRKMSEFGVFSQFLTYLKFVLMPWVIRRRDSCPTWYNVRKAPNDEKTALAQKK